MRISAVAAMSENRVIGYNNRLPWHLPADLKRFKDITIDKPVLMGRTTHEAIGRVLPDRCNIVITRDPNYHAPGCVVVYSIEDALFAASYSEDIYVIGGEKLFYSMMPKVQRLFLTIIHQNFDGDTFFPEINYADWDETEKKEFEPDEKNQYAYTFLTLERK